MSESTGDGAPSDTSGIPGTASNTVLNHGLISRGSYDERGSRLKTALLWILGLAAIAIVITLVVDLVAGIGMFSS
jgi:hypothetical protein